LAAALTAAIWPACAVVLGHLASAILGHANPDVAVQRAVIGLTAALGGTLVVAPALTLALLWITRAARAETVVSLAGPAAMGIIWPVWTAGLVLLFPPLFGLGPESGELLWCVAALAISLRVLTSGAADGFGVRRRWRRVFATRGVLVFTLLFAAVLIAPAAMLRFLIGAQSVSIPQLAETTPLPLPPTPEW
jgi:hypothetical protein